MLRSVMSSFIATLQLFLLLPALSLLMLSRRTPRARSSRHGAYVASASVLGVLAAMGALVSLSLFLGGEEPVDTMFSFLPPVITGVAVLLVLHRGLSAPTRRHRHA
jgi:hypothetical protein